MIMPNQPISPDSKLRTRRGNMEIGPIIGIHPITMVKPLSSAPDLTGVFAVEFRGQEQEETYSPSHQRAARGLEDEESESFVETTEEPFEEKSFDGDRPTQSSGKVSFFA
jgi:hypothetical protein